jgi:hypothetical protein
MRHSLTAFNSSSVVAGEAMDVATLEAFDEVQGEGFEIN